MLENALYFQVFVPFRNFIKREEFAGILLLIFTLIALVWANSPWHNLYIDLQQMDVAFQIGAVTVSQTVIHWINDGLMAIFFFRYRSGDQTGGFSRRALFFQAGIPSDCRSYWRNGCPGTYLYDF